MSDDIAVPNNTQPQTVQARAPITIWYRLVDDKYEHNHIEDGWVEGLKPVGKFDHQTKNWSKGTWVSERAWLIDGKVVRLDEVQSIACCQP